MNTQKIIDNIIGKKRKLKQYDINLDNINTIKELESLLMMLNLDLTGKQPIPNYSFLIFDDGKIIQIHYRKQIILKEPISNKSFMTLNYILKNRTYVILSKKFDVDEIYDIIKEVYENSKR